MLYVVYEKAGLKKYENKYCWKHLYTVTAEHTVQLYIFTRITEMVFNTSVGLFS